MEDANVSCWEICTAVLLVGVFGVCKGIDYVGFSFFFHSSYFLLLLCGPMHIPPSSPKPQSLSKDLHREASV